MIFWENQKTTVWPNNLWVFLDLHKMRGTSIKAYFSKWWFDGDLPWYKVKNHLKQIQNKSQVLQAVTSLGLTFRVANKHGSPAISVVYWLVKTGFFLTSLKMYVKNGWRSCGKNTTTNGSDWVLQDPSNEQSNFMGLSLFHMTYRG